jgi:TMEM175 potassium channel family protein
MGEVDERDGGLTEAARAAAERLTFFSDAVVAIAITLLAIDLPVPEGNSVEELLASLEANSYEYLAFVISFLVIANHWTIHHRVFGWVRRVDGPVIRLNLFWLLLVVVNPFLTRVLTEGDSNILRFGMYATAQALMMLALAGMIATVARRHWFAADAPESLTRHGYLRSLLGAAVFVVSVPAYLLIGQWAFAIWALGPILGGWLLRSTGVVAPR